MIPTEYFPFWRKAYLFRDTRYLQYDITRDRVDPGYPRTIAGNWPGFVETGFDVGVDTAINWGNGKIYFFLGAEYIRYDVAADRVDPGYPLPIAGNWPGIREAFSSWIGLRVFAAINWGNGKAYFFNGSRYVRYDIAADRVDPGYPLPIAGYWPGLAEAGFAGGFDAAINWGNGKVYFFKGRNYVRYDIAADRVDPGYPLRIAGNWPGVAEAGFDSGTGPTAGIGIYAAITWP